MLLLQEIQQDISTCTCLHLFCSGRNGVALKYQMATGTYTVKLDTGESFALSRFNLQEAPAFGSRVEDSRYASPGNVVGSHI